MSAVLDFPKLDRGLKRCRDCVFHADDFGTLRCTRSVKVNHVTGEEGHYSCDAERTYTVGGGCGPKAIHFMPTEAYEAARSVRRMQNQRAIEDAITQLHPDTIEAQEISDALAASLKGRYGDHAQDALELLKEFRQALDELEGAIATA